jgi:hypothetical protein
MKSPGGNDTGASPATQVPMHGAPKFAESVDIRASRRFESSGTAVAVCSGERHGAPPSGVLSILTGDDDES